MESERLELSLIIFLRSAFSGFIASSKHYIISVNLLIKTLSLSFIFQINASKLSVNPVETSLKLACFECVKSSTICITQHLSWHCFLGGRKKLLNPELMNFNCHRAKNLDVSYCVEQKNEMCKCNGCVGCWIMEHSPSSVCVFACVKQLLCSSGCK